ncbi:hypothetical protein K6119_13365 [Paracrocinitomix mangrovi]|uniref:LVIVD repeat-containing protein n=1 Tax=Paracrocinitomix mangrovi TaxID=2862509 RepID=UPI001C8D9574|nr:hypothetical protein [Paracrocinitomix mangrovi]UKN00720.1 hypothetical protein K6119_13365 [Paracrocinitomix mangrovi]
MKKLRLIVAGALVLGVITSCDKEEINTNEAEEETSSTSNTKAPTSTGEGGSLAQFTIVENHLYTIDYKTLNIFDLSNPDEPVLVETINMGVGLETVFHQNGRLFIGANNGVHIYDITDPRSPQEISQFNHVTSCDPVVANDHYVYATLRGGTTCGGVLSQLDVIDISNVQFPNLAGTYELMNPYGLAISKANEQLVYVCDGYEGVKVMDVSNPYGIQIVQIYEGLEALDIIEDDNNHLILLTRTGIYQFDATNPTDLIEKSFIPVQ